MGRYLDADGKYLWPRDLKQIKRGWVLVGTPTQTHPRFLTGNASIKVTPALRAGSLMATAAGPGSAG